MEFDHVGLGIVVPGDQRWLDRVGEGEVFDVDGPSAAPRAEVEANVDRVAWLDEAHIAFEFVGAQTERRRRDAPRKR